MELAKPRTVEDLVGNARRYIDHNNTLGGVFYLDVGNVWDAAPDLDGCQLLNGWWFGESFVEVVDGDDSGMVLASVSSVRPRTSIDICEFAERSTGFKTPHKRVVLDDFYHGDVCNIWKVDDVSLGSRVLVPRVEFSQNGDPFITWEVRPRERREDLDLAGILQKRGGFCKEDAERFSRILIGEGKE